MGSPIILRRSIATLQLPRPVPALISYGKGIIQKVTNNPAFPTPSPTVAVLAAALADLEAAETAAQTRARGTATVRNQKRATFVTLLDELRSYVQTVANADPETAAAVIQSAGIAVRKQPTRAARSFAARAGTVSGTARLVAPGAGPRASYEWQYSTDGGKTWVLAPVTLQASTVIPNLPVATTVEFRYRAVTKAGEGNWSAPVPLVVQ